jgi:hypothetical protein
MQNTMEKLIRDSHKDLVGIVVFSKGTNANSVILKLKRKKEKWLLRESINHSLNGYIPLAYFGYTT